VALLGAAPRIVTAQDPPAPGDTAATLPPAGFGTLRQETVAVRLLAGNVEVRVLPLDEQVIRLLANDSYESLHALRESRSRAVAEAAARRAQRRPSLFVVTFFGLQPQSPFVPEDVTITSRNRFFRPLEILPLSPLWNELRLNQRETATAVYIYEEGIALLEPFTVSYGGFSSPQWDHTLRTLDQERARVLARSGIRKS
jgi:hypothetical protein